MRERESSSHFHLFIICKEGNWFLNHWPKRESALILVLFLIFILAGLQPPNNMA